jgi:phosphatidylserine decarboxylase
MRYRDNRFPVAREAWPFALPLLIAAALAAFAHMPIVSVSLGVVTVAVLAFFRNPARRTPEEALVIVAPADGKVVAAGIVECPDFPDGQALRIGVFMSLLDVHMNWTPCAARVLKAEHYPGRFLNAMEDKASVENERKVLLMEHDGGANVIVKLVAGLVARRIVCPAQPGDVFAAGEKIGLIRFGSRVEVLLPAASELKVGLNARVRGGETIIARIPGASGQGRTDS